MTVQKFQAISYDPNHNMMREIAQMAIDWQKTHAHLSPFKVVVHQEMNITEFGNRLVCIFSNEIQVTSEFTDPFKNL